MISLQDLTRAPGRSLSSDRLSPEGLLLLLGDFAAGRISLPEKAVSNLQAANAVPCAGAVHVYIWVDVSPFIFFSRLLSNPAPMGDPSFGPGSWRHTIVVHIHGLTKTTSRLDTPI
jgi:hypothetical protein